MNICSDNRVVSFPLHESLGVDDVDQKGFKGNTIVGREGVALRVVFLTSDGTLFRGLIIELYSSFPSILTDWFESDITKMR
jgi:hypothetical protein